MRPGDDVARGLCHRDVDHAAFEQHAGVTLGDGCVERLDQPAAFRDLRSRRAVEPVGRLDLRGMDQRAPAIAERAGQPGVRLEAGQVLHVGEHAVERAAAARGARRDQHLLAGVLQRPALIRKDAAEVGHQVAVLRAAERNRFRARRRFGEIERAHHAARGLDGQDDLERAGRQSGGTLLRADRPIDRAQGVDRFGLRQEDAGNARRPADRVEVFLKIWRVRRIRADPDGFPVQRRRMGREALARGRLLRRPAPSPRNR